MKSNSYFNSFVKALKLKAQPHCTKVTWSTENIGRPWPIRDCINSKLSKPDIYSIVCQL